MNQEKKLLYVMGIDWSWIYQRPQVLAEKLSEDYDITVLFPRSILKFGKQPVPQKAVMKMRILWTLPFQEKNRLIYLLSCMLNAGVLREFRKHNLIFIGYPVYARHILYTDKTKVIYDCMDYYELLYPDQKRVAKVIAWEKQLIQKCDLLLVTSSYLKRKADEIAGSSKGCLIRNAPSIQNIFPPKLSQKRGKYEICYIGTISEWFDYDTIIYSLDRCENTFYTLIGPAERRIDHQRVTYKGVIKHSDLGSEIKNVDCLVMPFQITPLVEAVDPVKLYEYIAFGKCIVSVYYPEIERFQDYVYFYKTKEDYVLLLKELAEQGFPPKYNEQQQRKFFAENTWDKRYEELKRKMNALEEK